MRGTASFRLVRPPPHFSLFGTPTLDHVSQLIRVLRHTFRRPLHTLFIHLPPFKSAVIAPTEFAERRCSESGQWASMLNAASALGDWTDIGTNTTTTATTMMTTSKTTTTLPLSIASSLIADESIVYNGSVSGGGLTVGAAGRGWTNYTPCFTPELHDLMRRLNETGNAETILDIAARTRVLEYVGLSVSLVALLVSLGIFFRFR